MKVLITGSSGFVGSNLKKYLTNIGIQYEGLSIRKGVPNCFNNDIEAVIHLAGLAHDLKNTKGEADYFEVNLNLTKKVYSAFCNSNAQTFVFLSSVKSVADQLGEKELTEEFIPGPKTAYGRSKLAAEKFLENNMKENSRLFILRPCMIHGAGNKGNLNLLYKWINSGLPFPLGSFKNKRSYLGIENLCFVLKEIVERPSINSGIYNLSDDGNVSTVDLVRLIYSLTKRKERIWAVPVSVIKAIAYCGEKANLPLNREKLSKLTESYVVNNLKIKEAIGKDFPKNILEGLTATINSFSDVDQVHN